MIRQGKASLFIAPFIHKVLYIKCLTKEKRRHNAFKTTLEFYNY